MNKILSYKLFESNQDILDDLDDLLTLTIKDEGFELDIEFPEKNSIFSWGEKTFRDIYMSIIVYKEDYYIFDFDEVDEFYQQLKNYLKNNEFEILRDGFKGIYLNNKKEGTWKMYYPAGGRNSIFEPSDGDEYLILIKRKSL